MDGAELSAALCGRIRVGGGGGGGVRHSTILSMGMTTIGDVEKTRGKFVQSGMIESVIRLSRNAIPRMPMRT
jgi:hypothetical protein